MALLLVNACILIDRFELNAVSIIVDVCSEGTKVSNIVRKVGFLMLAPGIALIFTNKGLVDGLLA